MTDSEGYGLLRCGFGLISKHHELVVAEGELRVGAAVLVGELDLKHVRSQVLDHGANLSAA
jgi:hypothetical protein